MKFDAADPAGECVWANPSPPWWFGLEWSQFIQIFYHTCWRVFISWLLWHHLRFIMKRGHAQHRTCLSFVSFSAGPLLLCRNGSRLDVVEYGCCSALHWLKHTACGMSQAYNRCFLAACTEWTETTWGNRKWAGEGYRQVGTDQGSDKVSMLKGRGLNVTEVWKARHETALTILPGGKKGGLVYCWIPFASEVSSANDVTLRLTAFQYKL